MLLLYAPITLCRIMATGYLTGIGQIVSSVKVWLSLPGTALIRAKSACISNKATQVQALV